jgi:hypothetical protein
MCIIILKIIVIFNIKEQTIVTNLHISVYTVTLHSYMKYTSEYDSHQMKKYKQQPH